MTGDELMIDVLSILGVLTAFALATFYAFGCERL